MIGAGIGLVFFLFCAAIVLLLSIFWIWMLVSAIMNPRLTGVERLVWVLLIFFTHFLGALIYFFVGRKR
jgi:hypothetical protein